MLSQLLTSNENEELEFKSSFGRETIETLVAFANAKGGRVVIGVTDNGDIVGVSLSPETPQQWINQIKASTSPSVIPEIEVLQHHG